MFEKEQFEGNSASSRDIAYHLHSYTHPKTLAKEGPHIINKGDGIFGIGYTMQIKNAVGGTNSDTIFGIIQLMRSMEVLDQISKIL